MQQPTTAPDRLAAVDHVAICVDDIGTALEWYRATFGCRVAYRDESWAMLEFANVRLALVVASQHPPHVAFGHLDAAAFGPLTKHRDGVRSVYIRDPAGNAVELVDTEPAESVSKD